ncbi:MAG TPA: hypothetical protein DD671_04450 [Balneolaceae bacterium]|nr:hypothetical protein [Balneola sp.]HBQ58879.1 hypothetical protein [Balneolaceae bacterium]|tara:strand:- start:238194 stop:238646 length:453 start_codon:yes stop_codon:yes gene_type:complete
MKFIVTCCFVFLMATNIQSQEISYPERESLTSNFKLVIEAIPEVKGEVRVAIFDSREKYDSKEEPIHAVVLSVDEKTLTWSNDSLPYGDYAIAIYHDKNTNGELDTNLLGIPKEAYGFSNNARGRFGPASWEDASFSVEGEETQINISLQ